MAKTLSQLAAAGKELLLRSANDLIPIWDSVNKSQKVIKVSNLIGGVKSVDGNGWTVRDYGSHKTYEKSFAYSASIAGGGNRNTVAASQALPIGIANVNAVRMYASWRGTYGGHGVPGLDIDTATPGTVIGVTLGNIWGSALTYTGYVDVMLVDI